MANLEEEHTLLPSVYGEGLAAEAFDAKFWADFTEAARTWTLNVSKLLIAGGLTTLTVDGANTVIKAWSEGDLPRTIGSATLTGVSLFMAVKAANSIKL